MEKIIKIKNTSSGSAVLMTSKGNILIPPKECVEVDEKTLNKKKWQTISLHPVLVKLQENTKAIAEWKKSQEVAELEGEATEVTENEVSECNNEVVKPLEGITIPVNEAQPVTTQIGDGVDILESDTPPSIEVLKKRLTSLRISWRKTKRIQAKAEIAKEIKELEAQLEQMEKRNQ